MNCRPGDRAVIVRNTQNIDCVQREIGATVRVARAYDFFGYTAWAEPETVACPHCGAFPRFYYDADLQPIRGDGRETETPADVIVELTA